MHIGEDYTLWNNGLVRALQGKDVHESLRHMRELKKFFPEVDFGKIEGTLTGNGTHETNDAFLRFLFRQIREQAITDDNQRRAQNGPNISPTREKALVFNNLDLALSNPKPSKAKVSVITPTNSRPRELRRLIDNVRGQNHPNLEMLVCASGPETTARKVIKSFKDSRIQHHYQNGTEVGKKRNDMTQLADGDYVVYLDDGVNVHPHYLSKLLEEAETQRSDLVFSKIWHDQVGFIPKKDNGIYGARIDTMNGLVEAELAKSGEWSEEEYKDFLFFRDIYSRAKNPRFLKEVLGNHDPSPSTLDRKSSKFFVNKQKKPRSKRNKKHVLYLPEFDLEDDMVGRWRHLWPSKHLNDYGFSFDIKGALTPIAYRPTNEERKANPKRGLVEITRESADLVEAHKKDIDASDVVMFGRTNNYFTGDLFRYAKESGKVVGYEADDLIFGPEGLFRNDPNSKEKSLSDYVDEQVRAADFVTVTTPYLMEAAAELRGSEENVYIVKNRMDFDNLKSFMPKIKEGKKPSSPLRIGWAGGRYHIDKLLDMGHVFQELGTRHGKDITFVLKGINEENMVSDGAQAKLGALKSVFEENGINYELHGYSKSGDWTQYYKDLADLDLDVFFAPLCNDPGHEAKSELKYLESSFVGAPIVVPAIGGHKHAIQHGYNGLLTSPEDQAEGFLENIDYLIGHPEERLRIARNARNDVLTNYNVRESSAELASIYNEQIELKRAA